MKMSSNEYDAVIIGAGIGGLVCGCYLAKAGMKVLIAEQHNKPGGYCTSFKRGNFTFDAAAHSFGGMRFGPLGKIFNDLKINERINIYQCDPSDIIITPDLQVSFNSDINNTIKNFQEAFPNENYNIERFFNFLINLEQNISISFRKNNFTKILDSFFSSYKIKSALSFPVFGNSGLPPSKLSAFFGLKLFKEFLLDGGYYPDGGMQTLANILAEIFKENGGKLFLSSKVKKIISDGKNVLGIKLSDNEQYFSKYVISNCDMRQTYLKLLGKEFIDKAFLNTISKMIPSLSVFIVYIGLKEPIYNNYFKPGSNIWYLLDYNLDNSYFNSKNGFFNDINNLMMHISPDRKSVTFFINAPYKNKMYWNDNKKEVLNLFINKIQNIPIDNIIDNIEFKEAATPYTLFRYTSNYKGASFGWAGIPSQLVLPGFIKNRFINGLFMTGHWTTHGFGIPGVTYIGYETARRIINNFKR